MGFRRRLGRLAMTAAAIVAAASGITVVAAGPAHAAVGCQITYQRLTWTKGFGFQGNVTIDNLADPINGWTLTWTFPDAQWLVDSWSAVFVQTGFQVTATNAAYDGYIPSGGTVEIGFQARTFPFVPNHAPQDFALNGVPCVRVIV